MNPGDYRNLTFSEIEGRLTGLRETVWRGLIQHGPCTTAALAQATCISILTVRPRVTELVQLGLAELDESPEHHGGANGHEGVYRAIPLVEAADRHERERGRHVCQQLDLRIRA